LFTWRKLREAGIFISAMRMAKFARLASGSVNLTYRDKRPRMAKLVNLAMGTLRLVMALAVGAFLLCLLDVALLFAGVQRFNGIIFIAGFVLTVLYGRLHHQCRLVYASSPSTLRG